MLFCVEVRPYDVKITEDKDECVLSWRCPLHATHHELRSYCLATKRSNSEEDTSGWTIAKEGRFLQLMVVCDMLLLVSLVFMY